jgi:hypothetical protein
MLTRPRAFIRFRMMAGRFNYRAWLRVRPILMKVMNASSQLGERLGIKVAHLQPARDPLLPRARCSERPYGRAYF